MSTRLKWLLVVLCLVALVPVHARADGLLPPGVDAVIDLGLVRVPPVFGVIREEGRVADADMLRTFNMGVGLVAVCAKDAVAEVSARLSAGGGACYTIGTIEGGAGAVRFRGDLRWE